MTTSASARTAPAAPAAGVATGGKVSAGPVGRDGLGAVFTRDWVVEMVLDLSSYTPDRDLGGLVAVEPACGAGAFLGPMARRLAESCREHGRPLTGARGALRAYDLDPAAVMASRGVVRDALEGAGVDPAVARGLARSWVRQGDFLLQGPPPGTADVVVGNPPYVRLEDVPRDRTAAYRRAWPTMAGRADVYVGFLEAGLRALAPGGVVGFICADRWMRNQYGAKIRALVEAEFAVDGVMVLHAVDAFQEEVAAYPAVVVLRRGPQGPALVGEASPSFHRDDAASLVRTARRGPAPVPVPEHARYRASWSPAWFSGNGSWPVGSPERLALLADLERRFGALGSGGTRVGIGVASGADAVLTPLGPVDVEGTRLLPLAVAKDTSSGTLRWSGRRLVNPWEDDGSLVRLGDYPRLAVYLRRHEQVLRARHVARRRPDGWWRTIDKVDASLTGRPKLLLPDLKDRVHPVLDRGGHYPHHNLYYVVSDEWDLEVLGGLLLSAVAQMFVEAYSVRMANGCLRVSAQYLKRIRLPDPGAVPADSAQALSAAFAARDETAATVAALPLYGLVTVPGH